MIRNIIFDLGKISNIEVANSIGINGRKVKVNNLEYIKMLLR